MEQTKRKEEPRRNDPYGCDDTDDFPLKACSTTDCTGLIPSLPQSYAELESYSDLYSFEPEPGKNEMK